MDEGVTKEDTETKSICQIRVRFSDLESETNDPFMRFWVILSNLRQERVEGHPVKVLVDTGANCNTISRKFYETLVAQGLECIFHPGPTKGFNINLVGKQVLHVTVDQVIVQTEVGTSSGNFLSGLDFLVLDDNVEDMVMGSNGIIQSLVVPLLTTLKF